MGIRNLGCLSACARPVISPNSSTADAWPKARGGWWTWAYATAGRAPEQGTRECNERKAPKRLRNRFKLHF